MGPGGMLQDTTQRDEWVQDSSVDHKGKVPRRASTGVWKAALFIIAIEFSERMSFYGLLTNLIIYLTKVLHEEMKVAAKNVNYWTGVTTILSLFMGFVADAYLGRFSTALLSSLIYVVGLGLLTMSQLVPALKPCDGNLCHGSMRLHKVVFFVALYLVSFGTGGHKVSVQSFGADQFDDGHAEERKKKMSYFNWWNFGLCSGLLFGVTVVAYIQDDVNWLTSYVVLTAAMLISVVMFILGRPYYRFRMSSGSPLTPMLQVFVAALAKKHLPYPSNAEDLYEVADRTGKRLLSHTSKFRFLDKAAVIEHGNDADAFAEEKQNPWRLATVTQVEEFKLILALIPIWLVSLPFGMCVAQSSTFFIKQAATMDRSLTASFEIPPASVFSLGAIGMLISISFYDRLLVPFLRRRTGNERGISILRRMGIGMVLSVIAMATAAIVETTRLSAASRKEQTKAVVSMSVFWLVPQSIIMGVGDGFTLVGLQEYFYDQVPDSMRSLGIGLYFTVIGVANFLSSLLITVVDYFTERFGEKSWFAARDLNKSRVDKFYWLLAAINAVNLVVYVWVARTHSYKSIANSSSDGDDEDEDENVRV